MYQPVVGLEIHVQIKTNSKMFCRCEADYFQKEANINTCPVCFGLPGALPVPNKVALEKTVLLALALNCEINKETKFDRKNYFYPDLPKGYQISQYDQPIGFNGYVEIEVGDDSRRIRIERVHLEEDTAKSLHDSEEDTLIDYNKSGIPLAEIVTKPDFQSVEEVLAFAKRLRQIVRYLNVSDAEMQKGQMRYELNISVKPADQIELPKYKVEVNNIGSISVLEKVVKFETKRHIELLEKGEEIKPQTRGLKGMTGETLFQRSKETADDYRYFPEPDIPPIHITQELIGNLQTNMPELPVQRKLRYLGYGLNPEQAEIFVEDIERGDWFDSFIENSKLDTQNSKPIKESAKWILGDISGYAEKKGLGIKEVPITYSDLLYIVNLTSEKKISGTIAKQIIEKVFEGKGSAEKIVEDEKYLEQTDSGDISEFIKQAIESNQKVVADIQKNPNAIKFLVGQVMRLSKGKADAVSVEAELKKQLKME